MNEPIWSTYPHGKLLLTGEYAVLDGALALAVPVRYGQHLEIFADEKPGQLLWTSRDRHGAVWFEAAFGLPGLNIRTATHDKTAGVLQQMLQACRRQNPDFLAGNQGYAARTLTDFPRNWGLGTSSTLIAALANWAKVDPYRVLAETLGGSGYDIACAYAEGPLLYQISAERGPVVQPVAFQPAFAAQLFFVFLGKKQNSREGIGRYRASPLRANSGLVNAISALTRQCLAAQSLPEFAAVLLEHERQIAQALELPRAQDMFFAGFPGVIKSLGAWGGDFVLAVSTEDDGDAMEYFDKKGFSTCIPYQEMVL